MSCKYDTQGGYTCKVDAVKEGFADTHTHTHTHARKCRCPDCHCAKAHAHAETENAMEHFSDSKTKPNTNNKPTQHKPGKSGF